MSDPVISVRNVSKAYRIWESPAARLLSPLQASLGLKARAAKSYRDFWALKDISFEVNKGEAVGIIGRNGSGKSTLLQIIAGTLQPTAGEVKVNGRVAALLELGSGFNPQFTGRENVYLSGAVLGLPRREIDARFDAIAAFADIGEFIEQPVNTYSSGMTIRLAFAVNAAVEADVLIVDEAIAVGDEAFQRKCFARLEYLRSQGTTILIVTHATPTVLEFCDRAFFLHGGKILAHGHPKPVVQQYHRLLYATPQSAPDIIQALSQASAKPLEAGMPDPGHPSSPAGPSQIASYDPNFRPQSTISYASLGALIHNVRILLPDGTPVNVLAKYGTYDYCFDVRFDRDFQDVRMAHAFKTIAGIELGGTTLRNPPHSIPAVTAGQTARVRIRFRCLLNAGTYLGNAGVLAPEGKGETYLHRMVDAVIFRVATQPRSNFSCYVDFDFEPLITLLPGATQSP